MNFNTIQTNIRKAQSSVIDRAHTVARAIQLQRLHVIQLQQLNHLHYKAIVYIVIWVWDEFEKTSTVDLRLPKRGFQPHPDELSVHVAREIIELLTIEPR